MIGSVLDFLARHQGYVDFAVGLFCGVPIGMMVIALCQSAGRQEPYEQKSSMPRVIKR